LSRHGSTGPNDSRAQWSPRWPLSCRKNLTIGQ
jgi:hypothetical protein